MRVVVSLGGNALLRRGEATTVHNQQVAIAAAAAQLGPLASGVELVVTHGNGPQVGLLALQAAAYDDAAAYPFDVMDAQTEGMIGYLLERELRNQLSDGRSVVSVLTMVEVSADDPAFGRPTKFVGPVYAESEAQVLAARHGWTVAPDGDRWRRVVASPAPRAVVELGPIEQLLRAGCVVVCAGGGGIPVRRVPGSGRLEGVEAVVDKDRTSALLAAGLSAQLLVIATDVDAVYRGWGTADASRIYLVHPDDVDPAAFPSGSMGPKLEAAATFARTGGDAVIGSIDDLRRLVEGGSGTRVSLRCRRAVVSTAHPGSRE